MKFPPWARMVWWILLLGLVTVFVYKRYPAFASGSATGPDLFLFLIFVALWLLPLFQEMTFFGIKLKKEVESIRSDMKEGTESLRNEIRNTLSVRTEFSPQFMFPPPAPDAQLPAIEERVQSAVEAALRRFGIEGTREIPQQMAVGDDISYLFWARYTIEREIRRIWTQRFGDETRRRPVPIPRILEALVETQIIDARLAGAVREVYSVCSPAIHGEDVTEAQVRFVRDVAPGLITALMAIQ